MYGPEFCLYLNMPTGACEVCCASVSCHHTYAGDCRGIHCDSKHVRSVCCMVEEEHSASAQAVCMVLRSSGGAGRGRGGRGRGRSGSRQAAATPEPGAAEAAEQALPPPARTRAGRGAGKRNGRRGAQKPAARDGLALPGAPYGMSLVDGPPRAVQPFVKLMQALEGLDEGQGMLLNGQQVSQVSINNCLHGLDSQSASWRLFLSQLKVTPATMCNLAARRGLRIDACTHTYLPD